MANLENKQHSFYINGFDLYHQKIREKKNQSKDRNQPLFRRAIRAPKTEVVRETASFWAEKGRFLRVAEKGRREQIVWRLRRRWTKGKGEDERRRGVDSGLKIRWELRG